MTTASIASEPAPTEEATPVLLTVDSLGVQYGEGAPAVDQLSLQVHPGELVALVGESGSGKTTVIRAVLGLLPQSATLTGGKISLGHSDVTHWKEKQFARVRGPLVGFVPQDPGTSLNPVKRIGRQVVDAIRLHSRKISGTEVKELALGKLRTAGLADAERVYAQYPHELSGGMRQRALIAIALASDPKLLIADEPTSALDVTVQKVILDHLDGLRREFDLGVLLVTHDLGVALERADRLVVMQRGQIVEQGRPDDLLSAAIHPYTRALIAAAPGSRTGRLLPRQPNASVHPTSTAPRSDTATDLLVVDSVSKHYRIGQRRADKSTFRAVDEASFTVPTGTTHAIVGESGAGKSTIVRLALGLTEPDGGSIYFDGTDTTHLGREPRREFRRHVQFVYQNPFASLDPRFTVARLIAEPLHIHKTTHTRAQLRDQVISLLNDVALDESYLDRRPNELSGGQAQRVAIARALAIRPRLVVLDEAVSALDVSVQAQVLQLLVDLQAEHGLTYLFITHDLGVVELIADTVSVMRRGTVVESGTVEAVLRSPQDPYTQTLIDAIPGRLVTGEQTGIS
ncbi:MAG: ABC transporter ATP-binding protein [Gordonia sp. (in: high G+C Gram-positive bacteria)]